MTNVPKSDAAHTEEMKALQAERRELMRSKTEERGLLIVNTGDGKGKSTAGFGMVARALGWGQKVGVVQYIKGKWITGERQFFRKFPDQVRYEVMGEGFTWDTQDRARDIEAAEAAWAISLEMIADPEIDFVLLDELNIALRYDYLDIDAVVAGLVARPEGKHVCVTGRNAKPELLAVADLVTEMTLIKHPFDQGVKAQRGHRLLMPLDRRMLMAGGLALTAAGCAAPPMTGGVAGSAVRPQRIVSLNPCLDVILVEVAVHAQIAALSHYAREDYGSTIADIARTLPFTYETAEEVLALRPDLVLTGRHSSLATRNALDRLSIPTAQFGVPDTVEESLEQVREIARLVGHPQRGEALVGRIEAALTVAEPEPGTRALSALVFMPGGFVSGPGTLMDGMMTRMGLRNAAADYGLRRSMNLPLEMVVASPPEVLLSGEPYPGAPSWAERVMEHPALSRVAGDMQRAIFPERLLFCGGPVLIQTAAALARARQAALAHQPRTQA